MVRREQGGVEGELDLGDGGNLNLRPDTIEYNLHRLSIYRNDRNVIYKNPLYIEKQNICNNGRTKRNRGKKNHKLLTWIVSFFVLLLFSMYVLFIALRIGFTRDNNDQKYSYGIGFLGVAIVTFQLQLMNTYRDMTKKTRRRHVIKIILFSIVGVTTFSTFENNRNIILLKRNQTKRIFNKSVPCHVVITEDDPPLTSVCLRHEKRPFAIHSNVIAMDTKEDLLLTDAYLNNFVTAVLTTSRNYLYNAHFLSEVDRCTNFLEQTICRGVFFKCDPDCNQMWMCDNLCSVLNENCRRSGHINPEALNIMTNIFDIIEQIKDPTTSIGASIRTIINGGDTDPKNNEKAESFLQVMVNETLQKVKISLTADTTGCKTDLVLPSKRCWNMTVYDKTNMQYGTLSNDLKRNVGNFDMQYGSGQCSTKSLAEITENKIHLESQKTLSGRHPYVRVDSISFICISFLVTIHVLREIKKTKSLSTEIATIYHVISLPSLIKVFIAFILSLFVSIVLFLYAAFEESISRNVAANDSGIKLPFVHVIMFYLLSLFAFFMASCVISWISSLR